MHITDLFYDVECQYVFVYRDYCFYLIIDCLTFAWVNTVQRIFARCLVKLILNLEYESS